MRLGYFFAKYPRLYLGKHWSHNEYDNLSWFMLNLFTFYLFRGAYAPAAYEPDLVTVFATKGWRIKFGEREARFICVSRLFEIDKISADIQRRAGPFVTADTCRVTL